MFMNWFLRMRKVPLGVCAALLIHTGTSRAGDPDTELLKLIEQQKAQIEELKQRLDAIATNPIEATGAADPTKPSMDEAAVKKIVADYLKDNPGAGMPSGVQSGFETGRGFVIRSAPDPKYVKWDDQCKIPFELRFRGRIQLDYYNYKVTDRLNHLTGALAGQNTNAPNRQADFSQLEVKRMRMTIEGTAFTPDLRFRVELDGNTRGLGGTQNNRVLQTTGTTDPNTSSASSIGGGVTVDHAVRLFQAWVAYDFHGCAGEKGCGADCPEGLVKYVPTYSLIAGKLKPFMGLEEFLGSANEQFVEFSMADWFFDADDDNMQMAAGTQIRAMEDRFFLQAIVTNGNESQFPNTQMDKYPGFNLGWWYDFGGSWNEEKKKWDLFGDCMSDVDYSCRPVLRVGSAVDIVPMDRRSLYGDLEPSRAFIVPGGPQGGTRLINVLNGDGTAATPAGSHAVDSFDSYLYNAFVAAKYHGFSLSNEWWLRNLDNFRTSANGRGNILYQFPSSTSPVYLFPANHGLVDFGTQLQGGYFVVPKKLELVARWSWIRGDSGAVFGNGKFTTINVPGTTAIPGVTGPVRVATNAFREYHEANEYTVGVNYYFKRQLLKWQTDVGVYTGGNPSGNGQSAAGFIAGSDGYLFRTQLQLAF